MPTATAHHPDGSQVCHPGAWKHQPGTPGVPLEYSRPTEERALLSAVKAWWHPKAIDLARSLPPIGATLRLDGEVVRRWERVPEYDAAGEVVGTRLDWVDVRAERKAAEEAAALESAKAAHAKRKPKAGAE